MKRPVLTLAVVVVLLGGWLAAAEATRPTDLHERPAASGAPHRVPVVGAELVCPHVVGTSDRSTITRLAVALPVSGTGAAGRLDLGPVGPASAFPARTLKTPAGASDFLEATAGVGDLLVRATGALAPGLGAGEVSRADSGAYRGLFGSSCNAPAGDFWFVGASTTVGRHSFLFLSNPDDLPAAVDVTLYGPQGDVDAPAGRGIAVPPHGSAGIPLENLAPDVDWLMVHVHAAQGRVAAALRTQAQHGNTPLGVDFVPPMAAPARNPLVPGVLPGSGPRRLLIGNPGDADTTAAVQVIAHDGSFVPTGLDQVTLPAHHVVQVDVDQPLAGNAGAVRVNSDVPLVAAVESTTGQRTQGISELAWSAAVPALDGVAVAAATDVGRGSGALLLSAPDADATVTVATLPRNAELAPSRSLRIRVPGGRTVAFDLARLAPADARNLAVSVTPSSGGPVYVAREQLENGSRGPLYTVLPLLANPSTVLLRPAVSDLRAGLPRAG